MIYQIVKLYYRRNTHNKKEGKYQKDIIHYPKIKQIEKSKIGLKDFSEYFVVFMIKR